MVQNTRDRCAGHTGTDLQTTCSSSCEIHRARTTGRWRRRCRQGIGPRSSSSCCEGSCPRFGSLLRPCTSGPCVSKAMEQPRVHLLRHECGTFVLRPQRRLVHQNAPALAVLSDEAGAAVAVARVDGVGGRIACVYARWPCESRVPACVERFAAFRRCSPLHMIHGTPAPRPAAMDPHQLMYSRATDELPACSSFSTCAITMGPPATPHNTT